ncbi:hypothetical protein F4604DRAFT_1686623 [Suillus subluteus]|nr:hypothetical protein F4604DRAFT_1686623 [Suillus subluteus]
MATQCFALDTFGLAASCTYYHPASAALHGNTMFCIGLAAVQSQDISYQLLPPSCTYYHPASTALHGDTMFYIAHVWTCSVSPALTTILQALLFAATQCFALDTFGLAVLIVNPVQILHLPKLILFQTCITLRARNDS